MIIAPSRILPEIRFITPDLYRDSRGYFFEAYHALRYREHGVEEEFVQDNLAFSAEEGVLRGLHYQLGRAQAKLISVIRGEIFDVVVDIRRGSPTFGKWIGETLSEDDHRQILIPKGFAHGYCVTKAPAVIIYKCSDYYAPKEERGIRWDDPGLNIDWPVSVPILSEKDRNLPAMDSVSADELPAFKS